MFAISNSRGSKTLSDLRSRRFASPRRGPRNDELCAEREPHDDAVLVVVSGHLNAAGVPRLDDALRHASESPSVVILDLRGVTRVDLAGALLIVRADLWIRSAGGRLIVVRGSFEVERFFAAIELDGLIDFVEEPPRYVEPVAAHWNFPQ
jgi:anti-anti-sigma factor